MARWQYQVTVEPISTKPEAVTVDRWWQNLALPVWRRDLAAAEQAAYFAPVSIRLETVSEDRWHQPLSLPLTRRLVPESQIAFVYAPPAAAPPVALDWLRPLADPTLRPGLPNQGAAIAPVATTPEATSVDRWFAPLSDPIRLRAPTLAPDFISPAFTPTPPPVVIWGWIPQVSADFLFRRMPAAEGIVLWDQTQIAPPPPLPVVVTVPGPADGPDDPELARARWLAWAANRKKKLPPPPPAKPKPIDFAGEPRRVDWEAPPVEAKAPESALPDPALRLRAAILAQLEAEKAANEQRAALEARATAEREEAERRKRADDDDDDDALSLFLEDL